MGANYHVGTVPEPETRLFRLRIVVSCLEALLLLCVRRESGVFPVGWKEPIPMNR